MNVLIDINHPAHVHFFKNLIPIFIKKGYKLTITARKKEITTNLLDTYGFDYEILSEIGRGLFGLSIELITHEYRILKILKEKKIDLVLSIGGTFNVHASWILSIPTFVFTDTENAVFQNKITFPFATKIITPSCFQKPFGKKQVKYNGYHELAYLHPNYFKPDKTILDELELEEDQAFTIMRFVSAGANHDRGHTRISLKTKINAVKEFSKFGRVYITSEEMLPLSLEKYLVKIPSEKIHHAMYFSSLVYGESATMASEACILGTPAIFLDQIGRGYTKEQEDVYGSVFNFNTSDKDQAKSIQKGVEILKMGQNKQGKIDKRQQIIIDKIDVTKWVVELIEKFEENQK